MLIEPPAGSRTANQPPVEVYDELNVEDVLAAPHEHQPRIALTCSTMNQSPPQNPHPSVTLADFQQLIHKMYFCKDQARGVEGTFMWLMEEVGELATALRENDHAACVEEFADVLAWLTTIANVAGVDLTSAVIKKYGEGCPGCGQLVCCCPDEGKP